MKDGIIFDMNKNIVSFDFDDTILLYKWNLSGCTRDEAGNYLYKLNHKIVKLMNEYANSGWKVIIVTSRFEEYRGEIDEAIKKFQLPVVEVYCTDHKYKISKLKELGVKKHYDDNVDELNLFNNDDIEGILITDTYYNIDGS